MSETSINLDESAPVTDVAADENAPINLSPSPGVDATMLTVGGAELNVQTAGGRTRLTLNGTSVHLSTTDAALLGDMLMRSNVAAGKNARGW